MLVYDCFNQVFLGPVYRPLGFRPATCYLLIIGKLRTHQEPFNNCCPKSVTGNYCIMYADTYIYNKNRVRMQKVGSTIATISTTVLKEWLNPVVHSSWMIVFASKTRGHLCKVAVHCWMQKYSYARIYWLDFHFELVGLQNKIQKLNNVTHADAPRIVSECIRHADSPAQFA